MRLPDGFTGIAVYKTINTSYNIWYIKKNGGNHEEAFTN